MMAHLLSEKEDVTFPLAALWSETARTHFLRSLTEDEALPALEQRRALTKRLLSQFQRELAGFNANDAAAFLMMDHCCELLEAELVWLDRTCIRLQTNTHPAP